MSKNPPKVAKELVREAAPFLDLEQRLQEISSPREHKPWSSYETMDDWVETFQGNPAWHGMSATELTRDAEYGGGAFYQQFLMWTRRQTSDRGEQRTLRQQLLQSATATGTIENTPSRPLQSLEDELDLLGTYYPVSSVESVKGLVKFRVTNPHKNTSRGKFLTTYDDFSLYHHLHPEWHGLSPEQMRTHENKEARLFFNAFEHWVRRKTPNPKTRKQWRNKLFPAQPYTYHEPHNLMCRDSRHNSMEGWQAEYEARPELQGLSREEMRTHDDDEIRSFFNHFDSWVRKKTKNKRKRTALREQLIPSRLINRTHYTSIDDWVAEYEDHPEWDGKSARAMSRDRKSGAGAFYDAFMKWIDQESNTYREWEIFYRRIFGVRQGNIARMYSGLDGEVEDMTEAKKVVEAFGRHGFPDLSYSSHVLAVLLFPHFLREYVTDIKKGMDATSREIKSRFRHGKYTSIVETLNEHNILKLSRDRNGEYCSDEVYTNLARSIFGDEDFLRSVLVDGVDETINFVQNGDLSAASITEQRAAQSKNYTCWTRMLLATNQRLESDATLEAFVKFYPEGKRDLRDRDIALNNYLREVGVRSIGGAKPIETPGLVFEPDGEVYTHALAMQFADIQTLESYLEVNPEQKEELVAKVGMAIRDLHKKGVQGIKKIRNLPAEQRRVLEEEFGIAEADYELDDETLAAKLQPTIDYVEESKHFINPESALGRVYASLGVAETLNDCAQKYKAFVHGDPHWRNIVVDKRGNIIEVDFETSGLGAPQVDEGRYYSHRNLALGIDEQRETVAENIGDVVEDVDDYLEGYHAGVIFKTLEHMRYVGENTSASGRYSTDDASYLLGDDLGKLEEHGLRLYSQSKVKKLVGAARKEFSVTN